MFEEDIEKRLKKLERVNELRGFARDIVKMLSLCFSSCRIERQKRALIGVGNCLEFEGSIEWIYGVFDDTIDAINKHIPRLQEEIAHYSVIADGLKRERSIVLKTAHVENGGADA